MNTDKLTTAEWIKSWAEMRDCLDSAMKAMALLPSALHADGTLNDNEGLGPQFTEVIVMLSEQLTCMDTEVGKRKPVESQDENAGADSTPVSEPRTGLDLIREIEQCVAVVLAEVDTPTAQHNLGIIAKRVNDLRACIEDDDEQPAVGDVDQELIREQATIACDHLSEHIAQRTDADYIVSETVRQALLACWRIRWTLGAFPVDQESEVSK